METKGFNEKEISEQNKEALQSETWQEARKVMKTEIEHFTEAPEIQHFATVKVNKNDNVYGIVWGNVVREYLKTAYSGENAQADVVSDGITYKVLKREEVTAFYDADGNTLFDVENGRLEKEYEYVMQEDKMTAVSEEKNADLEKEEANKETGEAQETERTEDEEEDVPADGTEADDNVIPMGKASLKEIVTGLPAPTTEEITAAKEENAKPVKQRAKEKLEKEMKADKDKTFAEPVIGYLLKRCEEDEGLAQDVVQEHKTWKKCFDYIYSQARKQTKGNCAAVRDDVVYEWAEDYYHKDDKAEEEKKAKKEAERKKREAERKKKTADQKAADKKNPKQTTAKEDKAEEKQMEPPKPKKNSKDMDGQMDLFSMMGM